VIAIVDYNIGNIMAIGNILHRLGVKNKITSEKRDIERADKIILPGNGAFDACAKNLRDSGLLPVLEEKVLVKKACILGICVGAQLLGISSEEGRARGLGWIKMTAKRFPSTLNIRVPHMGWNYVIPAQATHPLTQGMDDETRFYFIHSYYLQPEREEYILLKANYGITFAAAICCENIIGVQFHPEKSHRFGKSLLERFAKDF
jgi:imidazole glycerol-phosphate synthase subunit HisH